MQRGTDPRQGPPVGNPRTVARRQTGTGGELPGVGEIPSRAEETGGIDAGDRLPSSGLKPRQIKALEFVRAHGFITNRYYSQINDISERQALRELNELVDGDLLHRLGKGRACRYVPAGDSPPETSS